MGKPAVNGLGSFYCYQNHFFTLDFVIFHEHLESLMQCQKIISEWLTQFDLELKPSKTKIVHTLKGLNYNKPGFDFLGFNIRQYPVGKYQSGRNTHGTILGFKTIIKPSKDSIKRHYQNISETIARLNSAPQIKLITELNPIIRGWTNYFKIVCSKEIFNKLESLIFQRLKRWAYRRHPNKNRQWIIGKYWMSMNMDNWVFGVNHNGDKVYLNKHTKTKIARHTKVKGNSSPYDGYTNYWASRMGKHPEIKTAIAEKLKEQKGKCTWCNLTFQEEMLSKTTILSQNALGVIIKEITVNFYTDIAMTTKPESKLKSLINSSMVEI